MQPVGVLVAHDADEFADRDRQRVGDRMERGDACGDPAGLDLDDGLPADPSGLG